MHVKRYQAALDAIKRGPVKDLEHALEHAEKAGVILSDSEKVKKLIATIGTVTHDIQELLKGFAGGRLLLGIGGLLSKPAVAKGLVARNVGIEAIRGYAESPAQGTGVKLGNAALAAAGGYLVMANPYVAIADAVAPEGYKLSEVYRGTAAAVSTIAEGLGGDTKGAENFHARSKAGEYGLVMRLASEAGDFWAKQGMSGGLDALIWQIKN